MGLSQDGPIDHDYTLDNDYQGVTAEGWNMPVGPGESVAWAEVDMYFTDADLEMRFRVRTYANGDYDYGSTTFDSGDVDIPLK